MTETDLKRIRFILEAKQTELTGSPGRREEIAIEMAPDTLDEVQLAAERDVAIRNLDRDSGRLRLIRMALDRMAGGSYGVCLHCEEEISPKRVHALPWAAFCIGCQERMDNDETVLYGSATRLAGTA